MSIITKAVIPVSEIDTDFLPFTKAQPREMLTLIDKPIVQFLVEEAVSAGIKDILLVTGLNRAAVEDHFDYCRELETALKQKGDKEGLEVIQELTGMANIHYIQQKQLIGASGDAVYAARKFVGEEPFAVLLGDTVIASEKPCLSQLAEVYLEKEEPVIAIREAIPTDASKHRFVMGTSHEDKLFKIKSIIDKPIDSFPNLAMVGRFILGPDIFRALEKTPPRNDDSVHLFDAIEQMVKEKATWGKTIEGDFYKVNDKVGYLKAIVELALKDKELSGAVDAFLRNLIDEKTD